mmetsp:Transcript_24359/g.44098  ORF Transcript_24359/g.44098 Transcript_24359/m.44098 type:complete len:645 (-) Transcript_24359:37-1971(-)|eukprot:CAMPEP_0197665118 /NCGR_PEP_ID=MMETSP1338-20131121/59039_1 /TAXON_ID=43686 ORGANISM="Pelagodinium beii, Strain RCC1491" /NCGR_SAMPLE_ID=MMETSP1338 /ASSEMBLY_ACC=CAM_ASM_000754 /LENGTH=644 /DNA_ID=CAMNT_0043243875 /DNA_START=147 /DNA_END=2081 /DNA_ORIENTATION=-
MGGGKGGKDSWDSWDTWGKGGKGGKDFGGKKGKDKDGDKGGFGGKGKDGKNDKGKGGFDGGKGGFDGGKGGFDGSKGKGFDNLKGGPGPAQGASVVSKASSKGMTMPAPGQGMTLPPPAGAPGAPGGKGMPPMPFTQPMPQNGAMMPPMTPLPGQAQGVSAKSSSMMPRPGGPGAPMPTMMPPNMLPPNLAPPMGQPGMRPPGQPGMRPPGGPPQPPMMGAPQMGMMPRPPMGMPGMMALPPPGMGGQVKGIAGELAAMVAAGGPPGSDGFGPGAPPIAGFTMDKRPQLFMLIAQMATSIQESHMQQILEQCGQVQAFRRGKDGAGQPMSFGVAQFADAESAWKALTCLNKRVIGGQAVKVLMEENTENLVNKWKQSQKMVLRVNTDDEMEFELEKKAVYCKALVDGKLEQLYGAVEGSNAAGGAAKQRKQELRERETMRIERAKKRKAWRESEFARELQRVEASEKSLRDAERKKDISDRDKEENDAKEKVARELKLEKLEADGGATNLNVAQLADNRALMELVEKVQEEPRDALFTVKVDPSYLRNERIMERKLRPWLEKKIDLVMGGQTSDLVEHIIRKVNGASSPDPLIAELERFLDEHAEPLVERLWRMLVLELTQDGLMLPSAAKRAKKEEMKEEKKY